MCDGGAQAEFHRGESGRWKTAGEAGSNREHGRHDLRVRLLCLAEAAALFLAETTTCEPPLPPPAERDVGSIRARCWTVWTDCFLRETGPPPATQSPYGSRPCIDPSPVIPLDLPPSARGGPRAPVEISQEGQPLRANFSSFETSTS